MKRTALGLVLGVLVSAIAAAQEATPTKEKFSPERFAALQAEGELVLLDVFASWCPDCAQQQQVLAAYQAEHPDVALHILEIDFDNDKEWVREVRAPRQSTLILYRGDEQLWYAVAETRRDVIFAALNEGAGR